MSTFRQQRIAVMNGIDWLWRRRTYRTCAHSRDGRADGRKYSSSQSQFFGSWQTEPLEGHRRIRSVHDLMDIPVNQRLEMATGSFCFAC